MNPELAARFASVQQLLNQAVDATETRKAVGPLVLAVGRLAAIVEQLAHDQPEQRCQETEPCEVCGRKGIHECDDLTINKP